MTELDKMEPKNKEKFKVQFAHKDRLKSSPVMYMQKVLNAQENKFKTKIFFKLLQ